MHHRRHTRHALENASPGDILLFHHARGLNRLITTFSGSRYYHVGLYAGGQCVIESRVKGVSIRDMSDARIRLRFRVIPSPGGPEVGLAALDWAQSKLGERYAYFSIFALIFDRTVDKLIGPVDIVWRQRDRVSCGEFVAQAYEAAGEVLFPGVESDAVAPWDFAKLLRKHTQRKS